MRHVDDAHHAEGNGQANRGQQEHRPQTKAKKHPLNKTIKAKFAIYLLQRRLRCIDDRFILLQVLALAIFLDERLQAVSNDWFNKPAQRINSDQTLFVVGRIQQTYR